MEHVNREEYGSTFTSTGDPLNITGSELDFLDDLDPLETPFDIAVEIIKFTMCVIGTAAGLLIIYIIFKYKNMHKPVNIYIMNWLICGTLLILVDPSEYRLLQFLLHSKADVQVICVMVSSIVIVATANNLFMLMIMFQYFCANKKSFAFDKHYCKIISFVWVFVFIEFLITSAPCVYKEMYGHLGEMFLGFTTLVSFICFIVIHCMRRCTNPFAPTSSLPIALMTAFMFCWIVFFSNALLHELLQVYIILIFVHLGKMMVYLYPLVALYLFYKMDTNFALCTRILFRKQRPEDANNCGEEYDGGDDNNGRIDIQA